MPPAPQQPRLIQKLTVLAQRAAGWLRDLTEDTGTPSGKVAGVLRKTGGTTLRYVRDFQWGYQKPGFDVIRAAWKLGWSGRLGLLALALGTLGSAFGLGLLKSADTTLAVVGLALSLALFAVGWALALTTAAEHSGWAYLLASAYLTWYGSLIGGSLAGTVVFALPALWTLWIGAQIQAAPNRWNWLWKLLLGLAAGYMTFNALGLNHLVPQNWQEPGRFALGGLYFALIKLQQRFLSPRITPPWIFGGSLFITGAFFLTAAWRDPASTLQYTSLSFSGLLGLISFFWLWLGGTFSQDMLEMGAWGADETMRWLGRWALWLIPAVWAGAAVFGWLVVYPLPLWSVTFVHQTGLFAWVDSWSLSHYFTARALPWLSLLALLAWTVHVRLTRRNPSTNGLSRLNGLWIAAALVLLGVFESMQAYSTLEADAVPEIGFWPILVLVGGVWWDILTSSAEWAEDSAPRLKTMLAFSGLMLSVSIGLVAAGSAELVLEYTHYSFLGLLYLGLPLALYSLLQNRQGCEPISGRNLAMLFGLGCLSALAALKISPYAGFHLVIVPLLWAGSLWLWGKPLGRLASSLDGMAAGAALAVGFFTFWMSPEVVPIPFLGFLQDAQMSYLTADLQRPLLQTGQLWSGLLILSLGAGVGRVFGTQRGRAARLLTAGACALALAWLMPLIPGIPTR